MEEGKNKCNFNFSAAAMDFNLFKVLLDTIAL